MREIKFRAWDKDMKKMIESEKLMKYYSLTYVLSESSNYEPMQYTGLKDRHGVEIYEGDIAIILQEDDEEKFAVEWDESTARFILSGETYIVDFDNYNGKDIEIIGNIHTNPELLEPR